MNTASGILIINKEAGYTSFDVVAKLRGILHIKKIGHTGTLDPDAEGVLCVCVGKATKLVELMTEHDKEYETTLLLGTVTDTLDIGGTVRYTREVTVSENEIRSAVSGFIGDIMQTPPMYSAKRKDGKRLYELAREGKVVERPPVKVHIEAIEIPDISLPRVRMRIKCGKGTYIRSLCSDIGEVLGCGGCMERLRRISVDKYTIGQAHTLAEVEEYAAAERTDEIMLPVEDVLDALPLYECRQESTKRLENGNPLYQDELTPIASGEETPAMIRVRAGDGRFAGIYKRSEEGCYRVDKYFL